jgi:hypothetical protein
MTIAAGTLQVAEGATAIGQPVRGQVKQQPDEGKNRPALDAAAPP